MMGKHEASEILLKVHDLSISFLEKGSAKEVVKNVSFQLNKGEILGIVGESGSGKTVTCLSIMRLLPEKSVELKGSILFSQAESDLLKVDEHTMESIRGSKISMIFQEPMSSLNPSHRCGHQVAEIITQHRKIDKVNTKKEVIALFEKVKLPDPERIYRSYIHELSGGQLQRVMIAMAIANKPDIIVADEPTTALDVTVQKTIVELLKNLASEFGCAIIFISHDLGVIRQIADRVIVMQNGEMVENGEVQDLFSNPQHPYTQGLIACRPPLNVRLKRLPTVKDFTENKFSNSIQYLSSLEETYEEYTHKLEVLNGAETILKVNKLNKRFVNKKTFWGKPISYTEAVKDVSFEIKKGEVLGLVGESGCGKSTLGRAILRLTQPTSGEVFFKGRNVLELEDKELRNLRKQFQIILQDPYSSLNPRMKIGEAIKEPMTVHKLNDSDRQRKEKTIELLEMVGLHADHYHRYPHQFSGGQRQRINIARTLSLNPSFVVCDESVSALDVSVQAQVLNLLLDLKQRLDLSLLFISHDISVIKFISDHIMVMEKGEIVEYGDAEQVVNDPKHIYTKTLIEAVPG